MRLANQHCNFGYQLHQCNNLPSVLSEAGWCQVVWTKMNPQRTSDLSVVRELDGRLTTCMSAHIHTRSTRCVIWTVSQSLSEESADLTAATVVSVALPTASFTASVPLAGTERVICTTSMPINSSYSFVQSLSHCVSCRWLTTRYWPPSWSATVISASITTKLATPRTRTTFGDRVFAELRSCWSRGKKVFTADWCALSLVEKTEPWTSAMYRWRRSCQAIVVNPTFMLVSVVCHSVLYANIIPTHASDADKPNDIQWLLNSFALCVNFDDINWITNPLV